MPFREATLSLATHALNYGTGLFEGIRAYRQQDGGLAILFAAEHYRRLLRNGRLVRASVPESVETLVEISREILVRHGVAEDIYLRPLLYKSAESIRLQLTGLRDRIAVYGFPMGPYVATDGLHVTISSWQRVNDNAIPARGKVTGSYVNACLAVEDAHTGGFDEAILLGADGHVAEASSANLFVVADGVVATPSLSDDVLPGITRAAVMQLARDAGYPVEERAHRPHRAARGRRDLPHRDRCPGGARLGCRRPGAGRRAHHRRPPGTLLRRRSRHRPALRRLAHAGRAAAVRPIPAIARSLITRMSIHQPRPSTARRPTSRAIRRAPRGSASSAGPRARRTIARSRGSLVLLGGGRAWRAHASGNGAVDALLRAVDDRAGPGPWCGRRAADLQRPGHRAGARDACRGVGEHPDAARMPPTRRPTRGAASTTTSLRRPCWPTWMPSTGWWPTRRSTSPRWRRPTSRPRCRRRTTTRSRAHGERFTEMFNH